MGLLTNIHDFLRRKGNPYTQFVKYLVCGCISVAVDALVFYLLAVFVFPCLHPEDPVARMLGFVGISVQEPSADVLVRNIWIIKSFCFMASNATVYLLNVLYVFESGRHRRHHEVLYFFLIALFVFLGGTWLHAFLVKSCGWHLTYAYLFILALGVVTNYALRKFLVFKR